jgi:hypothetical protein
MTTSGAPADVVRRQHLASAAGDLEAPARWLIVRFEQLVDSALVRAAMA